MSLPTKKNKKKKIYHLDKIPVRFELEEAVQTLHPQRKPKQIANLSSLLESAQNLIYARAVCKFSCISNNTGKNIEIDNIIFTSRLLCELLHDKSSVIPYILTIGSVLEKYARESNDLLQHYYFDLLGNLALLKAEKYLEEKLDKNFGLKKLSNISPGSLKDWPIEEQKPFFSLFGNTEELVGVTLTDKMLMVPAKSISGIYFASETKFIACQLCPRQNCQGRREPYSLSFT